MRTTVQPEILDLRHYSAQSLRPLLEAESRLWSELLSWDYRASTDLLLQYLDARVLPGFIAVEEGRVIGYAFCVYEDRKAILGDLFALQPRAPERSRLDVETLLLDHMLELLTHSPGVERIESQLLLHPHGEHSGTFARAGFEVHQRVFMERTLPGTSVIGVEDRNLALTLRGYTMRSWQEADFTPGGSLIARAYEGHLDSFINDQYRSVAGSLRFLHNIIRFPGCGLFDPLSSRVIEHRASGAMAALLLCSRVRQDVAHVTQVCVAQGARGAGLASLMLDSAIEELARRGFSRISLTVTDGNTRAQELYCRHGFVDKHRFDAVVWTVPGRPASHSL